MKHSGLLLTSLALSCSLAQAGDSTLSFGDNGALNLHVPHVHYSGQMYEATFTYVENDYFVLSDIAPLSGHVHGVAPIEVGSDLSFSLNSIDFSGAAYKADFAYIGDLKFQFSNVTVSDGDTGGGNTGNGNGLAGNDAHVGQNIANLGIMAEGSFSYAYSISDDASTITGRSRDADRVTLPYAYNEDHNGMVPLDGLGGTRAYGRAANNNGLIAGYASLEEVEGEDIVYNAFYSMNNSMTHSIGTLGEGADSRAYGINNHGVVVGWSASLADNTDHVAFQYDTSSSTMTGLGGDILGGQRSFAFDINDNGQIAGVATTADGSALAFIYENGAAKSLGSVDDSGYSEARAINDKGQATGWSLNSEGKYVAFMYDGSTMNAIPGMGGDTKAYDINTHGHIVGDARDADGGRHAFIYKDGMMHDLYDMLPEADKENWKELREAFSISDDGTIVGRGRFWTDKEAGSNSSRAFRIKM